MPAPRFDFGPKPIFGTKGHGSHGRALIGSEIELTGIRHLTASDLIL
ncbi:hypothetical protein [Teichococcus deserti]|nr:hypothetical protein [Pseudoroseomonas deserti]